MRFEDLTAENVRRPKSLFRAPEKISGACGHVAESVTGAAKKVAFLAMNVGVIEKFLVE